MTTGYPRGSCRESSRTRGNVGRGERRKSGRTAWQMIFGYLASRGTGEPPHLTPGAWYNIVHEGGCRFMAAWAREEENASNQRQKKIEAEETDKVEVVPGVTVASLIRF